MTTPSALIEVSCARCGRREILDFAATVRLLQANGMLLREKNPRPDFVAELLRGTAARITCAGCQNLGVHVAPIADDAQWGDARRCENCDEPIPPERLEAFPEATLCKKCQSREDSGGGTVEAEYCPRCGNVMHVTLDRRSGVARYVVRCPDCARRL